MYFMDEIEKKITAPLLDTIGLEILMHRNAHFGSNFTVMLEYYEKEGVGIMPDFSITRIKNLQNLEKQEGKDLFEIYMPAAAKDQVQKAKELYLELQNSYEAKKKEDPLLLISDLLLTEEENPKKEIAKVVKHPKETFEALINLIASPSFYDPLYPGYGRGPIFAAKCLEKIQDKKAISPLFEALGQENFFTDEALIHAICSFGEIAKEFLFKVLKSKPYSKDNEHAAIAINSFMDDSEIGPACLSLLEDPEVFNHQSLATYLIFACSNLGEQKTRDTFKILSQNLTLSPLIKEEMDLVIKTWKKLPTNKQ